jgi:hypothetical protein
MKETHVTREDLLALRDDTLAPEHLASVLDHVASCAECAELADEALSLRAARRHLIEQLDPVAAHLDLERDIYPYVDDEAGPDARRHVAEHIAVCHFCRAEVDDLLAVRRTMESQRAPRPWMRWMATAAAVVMVAGIVVVAGRRTTPSGAVNRPLLPPPAPRLVTDPWSEIERSSLQAGRIDEPEVLRELHRPTLGLRGAEETKHSSLQPSGVVTESDRPEFRWTPVEGARYRVMVLQNEKLVARSGPIDEAHWRPPQPLQRGRIYVWQVEVAPPDGDARLIPEPPMPEALFQVAGDAAMREIAAARVARPDDRLLLGILYARAGMRDSALAELANDPRAAALAESVRRW